MSSISLGSTEVGAIYLGGTQIYPTGSTNMYSVSLTNVAPVYSDGGTSLKADGSNTVFFQGTYILKRGSTTVSTKTVELNIKSTPAYTKKNTLGRLVWNTSTYGETEVSGGTVSVSLNYGGLTTSSSFVLEANTKNYTAGECTVEINGTQGRTLVPAAAGAYPIIVWANVSYEWTSGAHASEEILEDPSEFEITITEGGTDDYGYPWIEIYGPDITVSENDTGVVRTAMLMVRVPGTNVFAEIEIQQNYV